MSVEVLYLLRKAEPGVPLQDLDDIRLLVDLVTDEGDTIPAGTEGTVVYVAPSAGTLIIEFADPEGVLVTAQASDVVRIGRSSN